MRVGQPAVFKAAGCFSGHGKMVNVPLLFHVP